MDWDKEPTLKQFAEKFAEYLSDVGCMGNPDGWMGSHKIVSGIRVITDDPNDDTAYEVCGLDLDLLMGCGCSSDIVIKIRKVE